jgi:hypothetical protein
MMPFLALAKLMPYFAIGCTRNFFFFLPPWWEYLKTTSNGDALGQCSISSFSFPGDLLAIGLAVLDILLRLAGFIAVMSIIYAGFQHQFTGGDPQKAAAARKRLVNSLLGLAIALTATALVTFVGRQFVKG